jgi:hypothetical protein
MRLVLALVVAAATAALGAVILGEYQLAGLTGVVAGALFGLAIAEVVLTVGGNSAVVARLNAAMIAAAAVSAAGLVWAAWISAGHDFSYTPKGLWAGIVVSALVSPWWVRGGVRRGATREAAPDDGSDA